MAFGKIVINWKFIGPLATVAMLVFMFGVLSGSRHRLSERGRIWLIGHELIATTNSTRLLHVASGLEARLSKFLASPAGVAEVRLGDEPSPIGNGTACSRLILSNAAGEHLGIRFGRASEPERFDVLGWWTITEPDGPANGSQPIRPETKSTSSAAGSRR